MKLLQRLCKDVRLKTSSKHSMFDESLRISVEGLQPGQSVTLRNFLDHNSGKFASEGRFRADKDGHIDTRTSESHGGTFRGLEPMGLFSSLERCAGERRGLRMSFKEVATPLLFCLSLLDTEEDMRIRGQECFYRHLLHPQLHSEEVRVGRLRGRIFHPRDVSGPLPGVIDLYGTAGGLAPHRAALLASHGFVVLSLAHFNYQDLPKDLTTHELEYFEEAAEWLCHHEKVTSEHIGMMGTSYGAEISLLMGVHSDRVKAVVAINAFHMLDSFNPMKYQGKALPTVTGDMSTLKIKDGILHYGVFRDKIGLDAECIFPIELSNPSVQFLIVAGEDDQLTCAAKSARILADRLKTNGRDNFELSVYPETGHLFDVPNMPHNRFVWHPVFGGFVALGGQPQQHNAAQVDMWKKVQGFFAEYLGTPAKMSKEISEYYGMPNTVLARI